METGTDIHSDFWKKVGVSARSFRIRLTNSLDEFASPARFGISACGQIQQCLQQWFYCNQCRCICNSYLLVYLYDVLLVQQLFTDECILSYLFHDGVLQWSSKGGVKFGTCKLCRYCR